MENILREKSRIIPFTPIYDFEAMLRQWLHALEIVCCLLQRTFDTIERETISTNKNIPEV